jgi:hypothetical protein
MGATDTGKNRRWFAVPQLEVANRDSGFIHDTLKTFGTRNEERLFRTDVALPFSRPPDLPYVERLL